MLKRSSGWITSIWTLNGCGLVAWGGVFNTERGDSAVADELGRLRRWGRDELES